MSAVFLYLGCLQASRLMHFLMLNNIFRSPTSFFDMTPSGRIVNRFAKDVDTLDSALPQNINAFLSTFFSVNAFLYPLTL